MSRTPDFDELVGAEPQGAERERLRRAHELLIQAGPPPELTPQLSAGPDLRSVKKRERRRLKRRAVLLLAAALCVGVAFAAGYAFGTTSGSSGPSTLASLSLQGTAAAPHAHATLELMHAQAGNWPMSLSVTGLRKLPAHSYYEVYLVRNGKPYLSCGSFVVAGGNGAVEVALNDPYAPRRGDTWIVTRQPPGREAPGPAVLRPA